MSTNDLTRGLVSALDGDPGHLRLLTGRLATAAHAEGILDISYRTVDSPVGRLLLAATEVGLVRIAYAIEDHDKVLQTLADRISPRILRAPARLDTTASELEEYFNGRRRTFDVPLDWQLTAGFRRAVLNHLPEIGYGQTATYASVARLAGSPKAFRAVGSACATNPLPVVVPCHRVVLSDGGMGRYLGGVDAKRTLLTLETPR
ncbi:MAG TPA: methylated-DNA--[protein]-cysteine S-methyltransferase [Streptosporangiaceae bacterium]|jgi:methylated-DNA-[protein]-cysteine S-methyltransferase